MSSSNAELACTYAALILQDDDLSITADKISTILKTAGIDFEPFWPGLFAKALEDVNVKDLITNIGAGTGVPAAGGAAPAAGGEAAAAAPAEAKKEEKKVESESEDEDMGLGLFD